MVDEHTAQGFNLQRQEMIDSNRIGREESSRTYRGAVTLALGIAKFSPAFQVLAAS